MKALHLTAPRLTRAGALFTLTCTVTVPGRDPQQLWITSSREGVTDRADPFVALSLLPAMKLGVPLISEAPVSRSLLESGLPQIQRIYRLWRKDKWNTAHPEFYPIQVLADAVEDLDDAGRAVGSFYSGGVDSSFSLVDAVDEVTDLLFIRDFETEFGPEADQQAISGVTRVAEAEGKRLIVAHSNGKVVFDELVSWAHYHGGFLASIALLHQNHFTKMHIPSSYSILQLHSWGSHPLVDPLWSTRALKIVHDRVDISRIEKTAAIAEDPLLLENLRVCWSPVHNCGVCSKCIRTLLTLQLLGRYEHGSPFDRPPITPREISLLDLREHYEFFQEIVEYCIDTGSAPEVVVALRRAHSAWPHKIRKTTWKALNATGTLGVARRTREVARRRGRALGQKRDTRSTVGRDGSVH